MPEKGNFSHFFCSFLLSLGEISIDLTACDSFQSTKIAFLQRTTAPENTRERAVLSAAQVARAEIANA
jgi:hypothetical protein